jgi:hypothetical protein
MPCYGITLAIALFLILVVFQLQCRHRLRVYSKYSDIAKLLNPPHSSIPILLSARAQPNERLARIFGLGNSFVSAEPRVHKQFIARAKELLRDHTRHFAAFPDSAQRTVAGVASNLILSSSSPHPRQNAIPFATFVQVVTMRLVVCSFLGGDIPEYTDEDVIFVVRAINELWASSKKRPMHTQVEVLERLNGHLLQWLPTYERPLDFVIPSYETMWRLVAVTVARAGHDRGARAAFSAYLDSPNECQYKYFNDGGPSVESFLCEVLRLHPPSRRLARATPPQFPDFPTWGTTSAGDEVADLEALHRDTHIWGQQGHIFDPMRFHPTRLSHEQHRAFIPFGYGPLRCIAFKEAPRFAAIVAASILRVVDEPWARYRLVYGEKLGRRDGWDGWSIEAGDD